MMTPTRCPSRWAALLTPLAALLLAPAAASAQTRPFFNDLPDLEMYSGYARELAEPDEYQQEPSEPLVLHLGGMLEAAPHTRLGLDREVAGRLRLGGRLTGGVWASPRLFAQADVQLSGPIALSDEGPRSAFDAGDLVGRHRLWGRAGWGKPLPGAFGMDLTLDYRLEHAPDREAFRRPEIGPAPFTDQTLDTRVWIRRGLTQNLSWTMPLEYRWRRVQYAGTRPGLPGFVSHEIGSSLGLRPEAPVALDGWLRLVGVSWTRTAFDTGVDCTAAQGAEALSCGAGLPARPDNGGWQPGGLNQLALRFGQLDNLVMLADPEDPVWIHAGLMFGGSWLWDESERVEATVFEAGFGTRSRFESDALRVDVGLSISRLAGFTPGGGHIVAHNRFEHVLEVASPVLGMGFAHRGVFDWIAHPEIDPDGVKGLPEAVPSTRLYTEWFTELGAFEAGAYHRADYGPHLDQMALDPWDEGQTWSHEVGAFLRLRADL